MTFQAVKDPDAVLDYSIDWSLVLGSVQPADTITSSSWVVDSGIVQDSDSYTPSTSTVWLSGGTLGLLAEVVNTVVTVGGRTHVRTIEISIKDT